MFLSVLKYITVDFMNNSCNTLALMADGVSLLQSKSPTGNFGQGQVPVFSCKAFILK